MSTNKLLIAALAFMAFLVLVLTGVVIWQVIRISNLQDDVDAVSGSSGSTVTELDTGSISEPDLDVMETGDVSFTFENESVVELDFGSNISDWAIFRQEALSKNYSSESRLWADSESYLDEIVYLPALSTYYFYDTPGSVFKMTLTDREGYEELHAGNDQLGNIEVCTAEDMMLGKTTATHGVCDNTYTEGGYSSTTYNNYCAFQLEDQYLFFKYALVPNSTDVDMCTKLQDMGLQDLWFFEP